MKNNNKRVRLNENTLRKIIRETVKNIFENSGGYDEQWIVYNYAKKLLMNMGYEMWREEDNPYVITVRIKDRSDINRIETILRRELGVKDYIDMSVRHDSNMFGGEERAQILLPAITHTGFWDYDTNSPKNLIP